MKMIGNYCPGKAICFCICENSTKAFKKFDAICVIFEDLFSLRPLVETRNVLETGEQIEYMAAGVELLPITILAMRNEKGEVVVRANPSNRVYLTTAPPLAAALENGILRREKAGDR